MQACCLAHHQCATKLTEETRACVSGRMGTGPFSPPQTTHACTHVCMRACGVYPAMQATHGLTHEWCRMKRCTCAWRDTPTNSPSDDALCPHTSQSNPANQLQGKAPSDGAPVSTQNDTTPKEKKSVRSVLASLLAKKPCVILPSFKLSLCSPSSGCCDSGSGSSAVGHRRGPHASTLGVRGRQKGSG